MSIKVKIFFRKYFLLLFLFTSVFISRKNTKFTTNDIKEILTVVCKELSNGEEIYVAENFSKHSPNASLLEKLTSEEYKDFFDGFKVTKKNVQESIANKVEILRKGNAQSYVGNRKKITFINTEKKTRKQILVHL